MNIIIFLIILALLVLVHEFGHFIVAKKFGIRVDEFGLGFPPKIFGRKFGETEYTLNSIPFGGFVKIFGENPADVVEGEADATRSMVNKGKWIQGAVLVAGVSFNIIFAWLILSIGLMLGLPSAVDTPSDANISDAKVILSSIVAKSPAEQAGFKAGDIIVSLKTEKSSLTENLNPENVREFISGSDAPITIAYKRGSKSGDITVTPQTGIAGENKAIGVGLDLIGILKLPIHKAFIQGAVMTGKLFKVVTERIFYFFRDAFVGHADLSQVAGPVGMIALVGDARDLGFSYLIFFTAILSINLAVINLIPFPALDGGRLFVLLIESIKRSPLNPKFVSALNTVGFAFLLLLMLVITGSDIFKLF